MRPTKLGDIGVVFAYFFIQTEKPFYNTQFVEISTQRYETEIIAVTHVLNRPIQYRGPFELPGTILTDDHHTTLVYKMHFFSVIDE